MEMNQETTFSLNMEYTSTRTIKQVYCVCRAIEALVCIVFVMMYTVCSAETKPLRPTCNEVEEIFETHFSSFSRVAQMINDRPMFYEWYYEEYGRHDIRGFLLEGIDDVRRRDYYTDSEWQEITTLFYEYQLSGIHMDGENFPIEFYWSTSERNEQDQMISISYLYYPSDNAVPPVSIPFGTSIPSEHKYWTKVITP